ncbi:MAG: two-component system, chemotaxis family, CheB/CheR fusion protein, partial [Acidobacteriaceae bacterium]|nr:two-component system, chemotaxis family, CheB/CheR fusion protein [Acidobacteriaceae bacterium]
MPENDSAATSEVALDPRESPIVGIGVVGIGASAGGLEACSALLKQVPSDTGLAFVVIQHLDPNHESLLPTLLARVTKIPVKHIQDETAVEPNHVYVMPQDCDIVFSAGMLRLIPREKTPAGVHMPIDGFFRSLAESCQDRAIGVILSGTGSDGALGLEAIKAGGGFTFAQDILSAKFTGMPYSAFATGSVDFVLPPEGIAQEIVKIAKYPYAKPVEDVASNGEVSDDRAHLRGVLAFLHESAGIDFSQYRSSTIERRVFRRMAIHQIVDPERYRQFLTETPGEVELLREEMIPRVTRFFRDPDVFVALKNRVFPQFLINRARGKPVRIWIPGCASGEEVYAVAICLLEFFNENEANFPIQIFGTDLSAIAIQTARKGLYPHKIAEDVSPEHLQRFFMKRDEGYQISSAVRELCVFANHDLIGDPPYSKLDLISCRNVLIYLDSIQKRIIPMFHYALNPAGFLMLGVMETARGFSDLFAPVDKKSQIYSRISVTHRPLRNWGSVKATVSAKARMPSDIWEDAEVQKRADRAILAKYAPSGVIVNENWQVLQVRGQVSPYLEPASGKMSVNVLAMAKRSGLALDLGAALEQSKKENAPVRRENIVIPHEKLLVNLHVIPLSLETEASGHFAVLFEEVVRAQSVAADDPEKVSSVPKSEFLKLQQELIATRERLVTTLDNHQQYTEDAQSMQEESLSNLEEVQSFNEELETTKEELQSTNEELSTVNEELQTRNSDLQQVRDFATSIVETVREPLVVLDSTLCVKKGNRAFYQTFCLSEQDTEARVIYDLARGAWDTPAVRDLLGKALLGNRAFEELELKCEFPQAGRKILRISAQRVNGSEMLLMSIEDITARRQAEVDLRRVQDELRQGQKMEAIGRLAGGVAHDFNNMLTGILGFSEMLMESLDGGTSAFHQAAEIKKASERAARLTDQLLAFSRRQVLHPQVLSLNTVILELEQMLRRLIGDDIVFDKDLNKELWPVLADPGQMSQVILNLALNARDAMPHGGVLSIRTGNTRVDETGNRIRGLAPGSYVSLAIADSGTGMDQETQLHIFEPFYTTKPPGSGTGLGLSTVFGIVEQSGGSIQLASEVDLGTTFWVDFPRVEGRPAIEGPQGGTEMPTGTETILVVEDEEIVRELTVLLLRRQGYTVLEATEPAEGLALCHSHPLPIHLLLTDLVMPGGRDGRQLAEEALKIRAEMRVLLMSAYTTDALALYGVEKG